MRVFPFSSAASLAFLDLIDLVAALCSNSLPLIHKIIHKNGTLQNRKKEHFLVSLAVYYILFKIQTIISTVRHCGHRRYYIVLYCIVSTVN